ncbi:MliC family protein [Paracoccus sp. p4-l81]|uniref:MliC family protein n=1 Tax=unclassified Paracoccus (in: a-proteobacteria) TaxID=2688777 RepID=UPI0035B89B8D
MTRLIAGLAMAGALAGCMSDDLQTAGADVARADAWPMTPYDCKGGQGLDVRFSPDGSQATIDQMGERILMQQVPSGSGARYKAVDSDYSYVLDTKGNWAALYESGDRVVLDDCQTPQV